MWGEASRVRPRPQGAGSSLVTLPFLESCGLVCPGRVLRKAILNMLWSVEKGIIETIVLFSQRLAFSPAFIHQRMHAI